MKLIKYGQEVLIKDLYWKLVRQKAWKRDFDFLQFSSSDMFCKICLQFDDRIKSCKNYRPTVINGC